VGTPSTDGYGASQGGALEMSNVDLATEFTTMITAQRGFQANSRVISTADQMLSDLVNLSR
jgi:flagellar hook protein FlgE